MVPTRRNRGVASLRAHNSIGCAPLRSRRQSDALDLDAIDLEGFARGVKALRAEIDASLGSDHLRHLRRIERWGRIATAVGLATAPIAPNPLSAAALAL